jgi:hypothetical protein
MRSFRLSIQYSGNFNHHTQELIQTLGKVAIGGLALVGFMTVIDDLLEGSGRFRD